MSNDCLAIKNLKTFFYTEDGVVKAVNGVNLRIKEGEIFGVVGESGCGKSIMAMSVLRLIPVPPGKIEDGEIIFNGRNLLELSSDEMRQIRGNNITMIFQEPMTSLNPVYTIGDQMMEAIKMHKGLKKSEAGKKAVELLRTVKIPRPDELMDCYPYELSGGMRQRVMIAMAIAGSASLLIADEPTTALDVTVQAQILDLMRGLREKFNTSIMLITHDLGIIAEMCDYVAVMYAGKIIEESNVFNIFKDPLHPYTIGLLESKPVLNQDRERLNSIPGQVPNPVNMPQGCYFHPRCSKAMDVCKIKQPELMEVKQGHKAACWLHSEVK